MNRIAFFVCIFLPSWAYSQSELGLKGGLNVSDIVMTNYINPDVESDLALKVGAHAGVFVNGVLSDKMSAAAELLYSNKGVKGISDIHLHYITLPLLFQYKISDRLSAEIGPEPGYMFSSGSEFGSAANIYTNKFDIALDGGFRLDIQKLVFGLRYSAGLFSLKEPLENASNPAEKVKFQSRVLQVSVGYKLLVLE